MDKRSIIKKLNGVLLFLIILSMGCIIAVSLPFSVRDEIDDIDDDFGKGWTLQYQGEAKSSEIDLMVRKIKNPMNKRIILTKTLPQEEIRDASIAFIAARLDVDIRIGGEEFFHYEPQTILGNITMDGPETILVRLPERYMGKEIRITLEGKYQDTSSSLTHMCFGQESKIILHKIGTNSVKGLLGSFLVTIGIILLVVALSMRKIEFEYGKRTLWMGLSVFCIGWWYVVDFMHASGIVYYDTAGFLLCGFLYLVIPFLVMKFLQNVVSSKWSRVIARISYLYIYGGAALCVLRLTGVFDYAMYIVVSMIFDFTMYIMCAAVLFRDKSVARRVVVQVVLVVGCVALDYVRLFTFQEKSTLPFTALGITVVVLIMMKRIVSNAILAVRKSEEKKMLEQQLKIQLEHYETKRSFSEQIRILRHDLKNHILAINGLLEQGRVRDTQEYLRELTDIVTPKQELIVTENPALDAILTEKKHVANKNGVKMKLDLRLPRGVKIAPEDWSAIVGNALDNAIAGCIESGREAPEIFLGLKAQGGMLSGVIVNPAKEPAPREKEGGLGLISIANAVKKYNGTMKITRENGRFRLEFYLYDISNG
ncbi:MAG: GHKL domain-containing protein [Christensenella hongkongensis]|uniref:sensor histidine kinase n=1 Tax=Christensenella hongkongensis TaxID=270498 RepID=UPI002A7608D0|nr:GHKL domain-containing protein [Christensenella hongkongensis]MDY3003843.1 GHKL domain-containing protein [Christensenella hongkongensis]